MDKGNYKSGMHKETYKLLFKNEKKQVLDKVEQNDSFNAMALDTIDFYSRYQERKIFKKLIKQIYKLNYIDFDKISYNSYNDEYEYRDSENNIFFTFSMLSDYMDDLEARELLSTKRYHMCHKKSIELALKIKESKVLTGYIYMDTFKYLHSVVEYNRNGILYIIDWTRDIEMPTDEYFELTKFKVLSELNSNNIRKELGLFKDVFEKENKTIDYKLFATFGEEIYNDLEKNRQLFKK